MNSSGGCAIVTFHHRREAITVVVDSQEEPDAGDNIKALPRRL
jgi:hypothetical protein